MALKSSRPITVRDINFRWKFKGHRDNSTRFGGSPRFAHVAVQAKGRSMVAWLESSVWISDEYHDGDIGSVPHKARFTPRDAAKLIKIALDSGWDPSSKTQFHIPAGIELTNYRTIDR